MEEFKRGKKEPLEVLKGRVIRERAKGRCEYEWWEGVSKLRCRELEGEAAIHFKGVVALELMPTNGLLDRRLSSQKVYCQRHAYALLQEIAKGHAYRPTRTKVDKSQQSLFH